MSIELISAIKNKDLITVKKLLSSNEISIDFTDNNETPLILAVTRGHTEIVKMLLEKGANVNLQNQAGHTALILAAARGHTEIVRMLLDKGANVNHQNQAGRTALILAVLGDHTEIVKMLLEQGADVNFVDPDGDRALTLAAAEGHTEIVKILIEQYKYVGDAEEAKYIALLCAAQNINKETVNVLLQSYKYNFVKDEVINDEGLDLFAEVLAKALSDSLAKAEENTDKIQDFALFAQIMDTQFPEGRKDCPFISKGFKKFFDKAETLFNDYCTIYLGMYYKECDNANIPKLNIEKLPIELHLKIMSYMQAFDNPIAKAAREAAKKIIIEKRQQANPDIKPLPTDAPKPRRPTHG